MYLAQFTAQPEVLAGLQSVICWSGKPFARHLGMQFTTVMAEDNAEQVGLAFVVLPSVQTRNTALCTLHADLPVHLSVY